MRDTRQRIDYADVVNLGFKIQPENDKNYFNQYGFEYEIIIRFVVVELTLSFSLFRHQYQVIRMRC